MVKLSKFFYKDAEIYFSNIFCPVCKERTGPQTICFGKGIKPVTLTSNDGTQKITTKSPNCFFRQSKQIKAEINYPFSESLLQRLSTIEGINYISPTGPHTFVFYIGITFDETIVKQVVANVFRAFVKEMASIESDGLVPDKQSVEIEFNGQKNKYIIESDQIPSILEIEKIMKGCKVKFDK